MKVKIDFVTNSSSSSFLIVDKRENDEREIEIEISLKIALSSLRHEKISTIKELDEVVDEKYFKKYKEIKELIKRGIPVYIVYVSNDGDNSLELCLYENVHDSAIIKLPGNVVIFNY